MTEQQDQQSQDRTAWQRELDAWAAVAERLGHMRRTTTPEDHPVPRPDRYELSPNGHGEGLNDAWLDVLADEIAPQLPGADADFRRYFARREIDHVERLAVSMTNLLLARFGQIPAPAHPAALVKVWQNFYTFEATGDRLSRPLSVERREPFGDEWDTTEEHVTLRAVRPEDLMRYAEAERRRGAEFLKNREDAATGAERLASAMVKVRASTFGEWARLVDELDQP